MSPVQRAGDLMSPLNAGVRREVQELCAVEASLLEKLRPLLKRRPVLELGQGLPDVGSQGGLTLMVWVVTDDWLERHRTDLARLVEDHPEVDVRVVLLAEGSRGKKQYEPLRPDNLNLALPANSEPSLIAEVVDNAFESLLLRWEKLQLQSRLALSYQDIQRITRIGQSMTTERDFDVLIGMILDSAREMTAADGGSIYVVERRPGGEKPTHLRFKKSALNLNSDEFLLKIDRNSMAGYCAVKGEPMLIGDVYSLSGDEDFHFNDEFDRAHNYYTKSMMMIPMRNHHHEVIGVIQLINRKRVFNQKLTVEQMKGEYVQPFSQKDMELISALAGQAAVAIQNTLLLQDIHNLFEGFVTAAVTAIEQRDPTTSGHSFRVANFTVGLAQAVDRLSDGEFSSVRFGRQHLRELRYASLLHDFGKVGVREKVLVKAKKLYGEELELIKWRFLYIRKAIERDAYRKKVKFLKASGNGGFAEYEGIIDAEMRTRLDEVDEMYETILTANEPTVTAEGSFEKLERIARNRIRIESGLEVPFLKENELVSLSIRRGNLDQQERLEIESHVSHTYRFLMKIPWTQDLSNVPDIARGHHEKLDGSGYPLGLEDSEISLQTRMMTISDIYDALTAPDRPYKRSLPMDRALDILRLEAKDRHVDGRLLDVFVEAGVFRKGGEEDAIFA